MGFVEDPIAVRETATIDQKRKIRRIQSDLRQRYEIWLDDWR